MPIRREWRNGYWKHSLKPRRHETVITWHFPVNLLRIGRDCVRAAPTARVPLEFKLKIKSARPLLMTSTYAASLTPRFYVPIEHRDPRNAIDIAA